MSHHDLSKKNRLLDTLTGRGEASPMTHRFTLVAGLLCGGPPALAAQHAVTSDLWRVAAATLAVPAPLAGGATALLWTPVVALEPGEARVRFGVTSIHAPEEVGANGGVVSASARVRRATVSLAWGRIAIDGITRTETSPEGVDGTVPVQAQVVAVGVARPVTSWLVAGASVRVSSGQLGDVTRAQGGLDAGVVATPLPRVRFGAATRAFDPALDGADAASYDLGVEYRSPPFASGGMVGEARLRYGATLQRGERVTHLITAGIGLGSGLAVDVGAARESVARDVAWRSRIGLSVGARHYRVEFGRDGGINGFGATYAIGLSAGIP